MAATWLPSSLPTQRGIAHGSGIDLRCSVTVIIITIIIVIIIIVKITIIVIMIIIIQ